MTSVIPSRFFLVCSVSSITMSSTQCRAVLPEWKIFIRGNEDAPAPPGECKEKLLLRGSITGEEAQRAYQEIIGPASLDAGGVAEIECQPEQNVAVRSIKFGPSPSLNTVMKKVEAHDIKGVAEAIATNSSLINAVDSYGWSLLMCAACAGAEKIVELLLNAGANPYLRDRRGDSCLALAKKNGHSDIFSLVMKARNARSEQCNSVIQSCSETQPSILSCDKCNISFLSKCMKQHLTSTVHLLSCDHASNRTYYSIPQSNRGYQLMLKTGWNRDNGLGPNEDGRKLPLKTILKKDRRGIGASKQIPRVTHFTAYDSKAVSASSSAFNDRKCMRDSLKLRQKEFQKDKWKERTFRREFS